MTIGNVTLQDLPISKIVFGEVDVPRRTLLDRLFRLRGTSSSELDVLVDDTSLFLEFNRGGSARPFVCHLGWGRCEYVEELVDELLLRRPASLPNDRRPLFGCHVCGDLWCGVVSVIIERSDRWMFWRDFAIQTPADASPNLMEFRHLGPFRFATDDYEATILSALS